jgi:hypothetical protein
MIKPNSFIGGSLLQQSAHSLKEFLKIAAEYNQMVFFLLADWQFLAVSSLVLAVKILYKYG